MAGGGGGIPGPPCMKLCQILKDSTQEYEIELLHTLQNILYKTIIVTAACML